MIFMFEGYIFLNWANDNTNFTKQFTRYVFSFPQATFGKKQMQTAYCM